MRLKIAAAGTGLLMLAGCADLATGLATLNDQMAAEQGSYYPDDYYSDRFGDRECGGWGEQGVSNNQGYARVSNTGRMSGKYQLIWSTGSITEVWLDGGEQSQIYYMTPSVSVQRWTVECS